MNWKKCLTVFASLAVFGAFAQDGNLIPNPGFEEDLGELWKVPGWVWKTDQGKTTFKPEIDPNTSQGATGSRSLKLNSVGTTKNVYLPLYPNGKSIPLPKGVREYTISAWVKNQMPNRKGNEAVGVLEFFAYVHGKGRKELFLVGTNTPWERLFPEWTEIRKDFTVPEEAESISLVLKFSGSKGDTVAWVDNLYVGPKREKTTVVSVDNQAEKEAHLVRAVHHEEHDGIYYPGEPVVYELHFRHLKNPGKKAEVNWSVRDFDSREIAKGSTPIELERRVDLPIAIPKDYMGYFNVKMEVFADGKLQDTILCAGMVIEKLETPDPFFSTRGCRNHEKYVRMGFGTCIMEGGSSFGWGDLEKEKGQYDFSSKDRSLQGRLDSGYTSLYAHTHFSVHMIPAYKRKEYEERIIKGENPYTEQDFEDYRAFCRALIARYGKYLKSWRVPDEIMLVRHNPRYRFAVPLYSRFCRIFYEELKKQYPEGKLYAGGAMFGEHRFADLKTDIWDKIKDCVDGLCVDAYTQGAGVGVGQNFLGPEQLKLREGYLHTFEVTGVKEFVNEETGAALQRDLPLDHPEFKDFAIKNARIITVARSLDQVKAWTHFLIEDSPSAWMGNFDYGAWKNYNPRPHAYTMALVHRELAFVSNAVEVKPHADIYSYVFKRQGKILLTIWTVSPDGVSAEIDMPADWKGRLVTGEPVSGKKGTAKLKLTDRPYYLELDASQDEVADAVRSGRYAVPEIELTINRKEGDTVNVFVENKTNRTLDVNVSLNGMKADAVSVPGMETLPVAFSVKPGSVLKTEAVVNGVKYTREQKEELYFVQKLPAPPAMDGTLKGFESVKPLVLDKSDFLQPIDAGLWRYWTGPSDLSAKLYLAYDKDYFYIAADVLDDVQISRRSDAMVWYQDCVQYAFDTENDTYDPKKSTGGYNPDDREFCMALTPKGAQNYCYTAPQGLMDKLVPDSVSIVRTEGRTVYNARIPWSYFGKLGPNPGSIFGFNAVFFDIDIETGAIPYRMELSPGIANGKAPAFFKRFMLK